MSSPKDAKGKRPEYSVLILPSAQNWRIRIGDYRVIYEINDGKLIVTVITIEHRRERYE
jgi:mRNA interferase RelE/StbE